MKKSIVLATAVMAGLALAGCGKQSSSNDKSSASSSSQVAAKSSSTTKTTTNQQDEKISEEEYAMMGFLKLDNRGVDYLINGGMKGWRHTGNAYYIDVDSQTVKMEVKSDSVKVIFDATDSNTHMLGHLNAYKEFSKQDLANEFGNDKAKIDQLLKQNSTSSSKANVNIDDRTLAVLVGLKYNQEWFEELIHSDNGIYYVDTPNNNPNLPELNGFFSITANGSGGSEVFYKRVGNNVIYTTYDVPEGAANYQGKYVQHTIAISQLVDSFDRTADQKAKIADYAKSFKDKSELFN